MEKTELSHLPTVNINHVDGIIYNIEIPENIEIAKIMFLSHAYQKVYIHHRPSGNFVPGGSRSVASGSSLSSRGSIGPVVLNAYVFGTFLKYEEEPMLVYVQKIKVIDSKKKITYITTTHLEDILEYNIVGQLSLA